MTKTNPLLGAHTSIEGGISKAIDLAVKLQFNTMQIFTQNCMRWAGKDLTPKEINDFKTKLSRASIAPVISHSIYLINLCANNNLLLNKSREAFLEETTRCEQLGIPYLNFHPGGHTGLSETEGIRLIADSINFVHERTRNFKVKFMMETTAGQGNSIGHKFEQLRSILEQVECKERMCVCIDTAHIFAAGYDIRTPESYARTMEEFDEIIGIELLKCIHVNDSKKELGSHVDRHENIGDGFIGLQGFSNIMNDDRLINVPKILETPKTKGQLEDIKNINKLKGLIKK